MMKRLASALALLIVAGPAAAEPTPRDGLWTVRGIAGGMAETCGPEIAPLVQGMRDELARHDLYDLDWDGGFDPNTARGLDRDGLGLTWRAEGDGIWTATLVGGDIPLMTTSMRLLDAGRIDSRIDMDVAGMRAARGGLTPTSGGCAVTVSFTLEHVARS